MLIRRQKKTRLKEMQAAAIEEYSNSLGLFKESEVSTILAEVDLTPSRAVKKIVRECGQYRVRFEDMDDMLDTITDFFIDNEKNFLQANSVLNGRTYDPLENYDRQEAAYTDNSSETHSIGARQTTVSRGTIRNTSTPGDYTSNTSETITKNGTETTSNANTNTPAVIGTPYAGSSNNVSGNNTVSSTDTVSSQNTVTQLASISDTEQLGSDITADAAASDSVSKQDVHAARRTHGNIGVTTSQQMAEAELQFINKFANTLDFIIHLFKQNCIIAVYEDDLVFAEVDPEPTPTPTPTPTPPVYNSYLVSLNNYSGNASHPYPIITGGPYITAQQLNTELFYPDGAKINGITSIPENTVIQLYTENENYEPQVQWQSGTLETLTSVDAHTYSVTITGNIVSVTWVEKLPAYTSYTVNLSNYSGNVDHPYPLVTGGEYITQEQLNVNEFWPNGAKINGEVQLPEGTYVDLYTENEWRSPLINWADSTSSGLKSVDMHTYTVQITQGVTSVTWRDTTPTSYSVTGLTNYNTSGESDPRVVNPYIMYSYGPGITSQLLATDAIYPEGALLSGSATLYYNTSIKFTSADAGYAPYKSIKGDYVLAGKQLTEYTWQVTITSSTAIEWRPYTPK